MITNGTDGVGSYLSAAYGLYSEGYLVAPLLEARKPGMMSFTQDGQVDLAKSNYALVAPLADHLIRQRQEQVNEVWRYMRWHLLKNLPLSSIVSLFGKKDIVFKSSGTRWTLSTLTNSPMR